MTILFRNSKEFKPFICKLVGDNLLVALYRFEDLVEARLIHIPTAEVICVRRVPSSKYRRNYKVEYPKSRLAVSLLTQAEQ